MFCCCSLVCQGTGRRAARPFLRPPALLQAFRSEPRSASLGTAPGRSCSSWFRRKPAASVRRVRLQRPRHSLVPARSCSEARVRALPAGVLLPRHEKAVYTCHYVRLLGVCCGRLSWLVPLAQIPRTTAGGRNRYDTSATAYFWLQMHRLRVLATFMHKHLWTNMSD